ncbi:fungal-specific transcription factor domain-containing protein [Dendryphion nanum]|uniref:Fungal-specific transcription factor domain-containing protein n=1 Tax=Dendryphion nanum TaxID=256645 RepID=A0A9P9DNH3_9PLEO|nr:fungal-specific transcription factor domain-containing protein [Dendryphion nanum]
MMSTLKNPRKSCDLCYQRKIKCDRAKPRCSHCITYVTDCTYAAPSRKSRPKKRQNCAKTDATTGHTQDRLRNLEDLVEQLSETVKVNHQDNGAQHQTQVQQQEGIPIDTASQTFSASTDGGFTVQGQKHNVSMALPPLEHVLPIAKIFLKSFNAALPLFYDDTLLCLIHNFYNAPYPQRDPVAWAAINIVLALAHRNNLVSTSSSNTNLSIEYLNKAESVLSSIVLGDTQLLNIQVLVGMVLLLQASPDLTPSLILIATTMRLAHKIGLHDRTASAHMGAVDARQRACVFWMAYILDKDLSMRLKQPSIQLDDDVNLELPSLEVFPYQVNNRCINDTSVSVSSGIIVTTDGTVEMNYFVTRIQLAVIEGGVYDYLYSTRSQKRNIEERSHALETIACALETWKASIPFEFSAFMAPDTVSPIVLQLLAVLHSTSLACTTLLNQANAWNTYWMEGIRKYAVESILPTLPPQWEALVDEARQLTALLGALPHQNRWNFWMTGCTHMTAILLLTFNSMQRPQHDLLSLDNELVDKGLQMLDRVEEETQSEIVRSFRKTCTGLHRDAQQRRAEASVMANSLNLPT